MAFHLSFVLTQTLEKYRRRFTRQLQTSNNSTYDLGKTYLIINNFMEKELYVFEQDLKNQLLEAIGKSKKFILFPEYNLKIKKVKIKGTEDYTIDIQPIN